MLKLNGILETALHVSDMNRSIEFYTQLFAWPKMAGDHRFAAFAIQPNQVFLLFLLGGSANDMPVPGGVIPGHDGSGRLHVAFAIPADALADWEKRLERLKIPIVGRVHWEAGGHSIYFRDPDGHLLELATPGIWPNY